MRRSMALYVCILSTALCWSAQAFAVPLTLSHQGRLLDGSDNPVSGAHTLTVRIYDAASGGSVLWTEVHAGVQVTDGLFEISLGSVVSIGPDLLSPPSAGGLPPVERFLEMQVDVDAPLTPRIRLESAPYSVAAARVSGDVETSPGELHADTRVVVANIGSSGQDGVRLTVDPGGDSRLEVSNIGSSGQDGVSVVADGSGRKLVVSNIGSSGQDGVEVKVDGTGRSLAVGNIGSSGQDGVQVLVAPSGASSVTVSNIGSSGEDGVSILADGLTSSVAINQKGTGADKNRTGGSASDTGAVLYVDHDDDGDGIAENSVSSSSGATSARLAIKTKGTGAQRLSAGGDCDDTDASLHADFDVDGDGVADMSALAVADSGSASVRLNGLPPGEPDFGTLDMSASGNGAVQILSGHHGSTTATIRMGATGAGGGGGGLLSPSSSLALEADVDGDGLADHVITGDCDDASARLSVDNIGSSGQDGVSIEVGGANRKLAVSNIGSSGEDGVEISLDGSSRRLRVGNIGSSGEDGVTVDVSSATSRVSVHNLGSSGQDGVSITDDATGAHVAIDTIPTTHRISIGGGAYCDGTDWVNGSDVNSKENFEPVDGEELLGRISTLPITRWNYKGQPEVEHIGPMAQDFQAVFGVGVNDKSISTVDPSGIALAAVKELYRQNQELQTANRQLQAQMEELRRAVMELKSR
jgi:hypothetical protein